MKTIKWSVEGNKNSWSVVLHHHICLVSTLKIYAQSNFRNAWMLLTLHFLAFFSSYVIWSQGVSVEWWGPGLDCSDGWRGGSVWPHNGTQDKSLLPLLDGMCCVRGGRDLQHFHIWPCHNVSQITLSLQIERGREREEVEGWGQRTESPGFLTFCVNSLFFQPGERKGDDGGREEKRGRGEGGGREKSNVKSRQRRLGWKSGSHWLQLRARGCLSLCTEGSHFTA